MWEQWPKKVTSRADEIRVEDYNPEAPYHMMVERAGPLRLSKKGQEFSKLGKREWGWSNIDLAYHIS